MAAARLKGFPIHVWREDVWHLLCRHNHQEWGHGSVYFKLQRIGGDLLVLDQFIERYSLSSIFFFGLYPYVTTTRTDQNQRIRASSLSTSSSPPPVKNSLSCLPLWSSNVVQQTCLSPRHDRFSAVLLLVSIFCYQWFSIGIPCLVMHNKALTPSYC